MGAALRKMREKRAGEASPFSICPTLKPCHGHSNRQVGTSQQEVLGTGGVLGERKCHESLQRGDPEIHL